MWDVDRLHLTGEGHRRVAEAVWQTLGYEAEDPEWRTPMPPTPPPGWTARRVEDARFARQYLLPWIGRRLTGRSSGDGLVAKRPDLLPYEGPAAHERPMTKGTRVINVRGHIHDFGPRLELAPAEIVYVGRRWTLGGWDLPRTRSTTPSPTTPPPPKRDGTRAEVMAKYRAYLLERPDLLALVPELRGGRWPAGARRSCATGGPGGAGRRGIVDRDGQNRGPRNRNPSPRLVASDETALALACTNRQ
jgi:hypothetical protein